MTLRDWLELLERMVAALIVPPCRLLVIQQQEIDLDDTELRRRHGLAPICRIVRIVSRMAETELTFSASSDRVPIQ